MPDSKHFEVTLRVKGSAAFDIGFVPEGGACDFDVDSRSDTDLYGLRSRFVHQNAGSLFRVDDNYGPVGAGPISLIRYSSQNGDMKEDLVTSTRCKDNEHRTLEVTITKSLGVASFAVASHSSGNINIAGDNHQLVLILGWDDTKVDCAMKPMRKRKRSISGVLTAKMYKDRKFTDAVIRCGGVEIPVHRAVCVAASPVFERLWESGMREGSSAVVTIEQAEPAAVEAAVQFIYTGTLPEPVNIAKVFEVAQMYDLKELVQDIAEKMLLGLELDNVLERCIVVRKHAKAGDKTSQELWEKLYERLLGSRDLLRSAFEQALG